MRALRQRDVGDLMHVIEHEAARSLETMTLGFGARIIQHCPNLVMPAQFEVWFWVKSKRPTIVSALRISRDRCVKLPPAFIVCLPATRVRLSKNWMSF